MLDAPIGVDQRGQRTAHQDQLVIRDKGPHTVDLLFGQLPQVENLLP